MDDLFKDLIWDEIIEASLGRLFLQFPFLAWGPLGLIINFFVKKYALILYASLKMFINIEEIIIRNEKLRKEFDNESIKLKIISQNFGADSEEFRKVRDASKKALSSLISFNN